jgi:hypothetical protein
MHSRHGDRIYARQKSGCVLQQRSRQEKNAFRNAGAERHNLLYGAAYSNISNIRRAYAGRYHVYNDHKNIFYLQVYIFTCLFFHDIGREYYGDCFQYDYSDRLYGVFHSGGFLGRNDLYGKLLQIYEYGRHRPELRDIQHASGRVFSRRDRFKMAAGVCRFCIDLPACYVCYVSRVFIYRGGFEQYRKDRKRREAVLFSVRSDKIQVYFAGNRRYIIGNGILSGIAAESFVSVNRHGRRRIYRFYVFELSDI